MKSYLLICALFFSLAAGAQKKPEPNVDSLKYELYKATNDTLRFKLLKALAYNYIRFDAKLILGYGEEMLAIGTKFGDLSKMADGYYCIGYAYMSLRNKKKALGNYSKCIEISQKSGDKVLEAGALTNIGFTMFKKHNPKALPYFYKSKELLSDTTSNSNFMANTNMNIGFELIYMHKYDSAEYYLFIAAKVYEAKGYKRPLAKCYYHLGNLYGKEKKYQLMEEYEKKAVTIASELKNKKTIDMYNKRLKYAEKKNKHSI